jgi:hypothetical protein
LEEAEGVSGVAQRDAKRSLQLADKPAAAAAPAFGGAPPAGDATRRYSQAGGAVGNRPGSGGYGVPGLRALNTYRDIESDREVAAAGVQNAGGEALYKRGKTWIANNAKNIDPVKDDAKIKRVKRFSDEYFALVRDNTAAENSILAAQQEGEELLVVLRGQAYKIE